MADDTSYNNFLTQANTSSTNTRSNESQSQSQSTSQAHSKFDPTTQPNAALPPSIKALPKSLTYTSDTDSPFIPVLFSYAGSAAPSVSDFEKCLDGNAAGKVEEMSVKEWDARGEYGEVVEAVRQAGEKGGEVKVFQVMGKGARVEYYVMSVVGGKEGGRKLVGVKMEAVES